MAVDPLTFGFDWIETEMEIVSVKDEKSSKVHTNFTVRDKHIHTEINIVSNRLSSHLIRIKNIEITSTHKNRLQHFPLITSYFKSKKWYQSQDSLHIAVKNKIPIKSQKIKSKHLNQVLQFKGLTELLASLVVRSVNVCDITAFPVSAGTL